MNGKWLLITGGVAAICVAAAVWAQQRPGNGPPLPPRGEYAQRDGGTDEQRPPCPCSRQNGPSASRDADGYRPSPPRPGGRAEDFRRPMPPPPPDESADERGPRRDRPG